MNADASNPTPPATDPVAPPVTDASFIPAPETPPAPPPKPLVWPDWFRPFDMALAIFAVVLAFLLGSFVARNPDLWRHLATGRMVTQFQYPWGGDPFTFTAADRAWVNANWLGEVLLHLLYSMDNSGAVAVAVKAIAFAAAIGVLFLLRKPNAPLWPWAVVAAAGAVAAGGFTHLRPQTFALPIMAAILAVLYTGDWAKGNKWKMPAILGGLTAVWANVDSFAFLSPLLVGLVLLGDWLHPKVFPSKSDLPPEEDPFRSAPPRDALLRALLLCAVGVLLNPTFLGAVFRNPLEAVAQLVPFELDWQGAEDLKADNDLYRYTFSALHQAVKAEGGKVLEPGYLGNTVLGANPSGYFAIGLWVLGAVAAGVGFRHGRLSHLLVWVVFTLLGAIVHARFVPYGVLVGVPFLAAHLNGFGRMVPPLDKLRQQIGQLVLMGSLWGRVFSLVGLLVLVASSIPGWLQPWNGTAAGRRYVAWAIAPDEGMVRSAKLFATWHEDEGRKSVLAETHGLNTHPDLGDYLAYYAPAEKSFITSRYRLHRTELADLVKVRKNVFADWTDYYGKQAVVQQEVSRQRYADAAAFQKDFNERLDQLKPPVQQGWLTEIADKYGVGYVSVAQAEAKTFPFALSNVRTGFGVRESELPLYGPPWQLDGRLLVVGRTRTLTPEEQERFNTRSKLPPEQAAEVERNEDQIRGRTRNRAMTRDLAREVFGRTTPLPKPPPMTRGDAPRQGWEYDVLSAFTHQPPRPVGLDDAEAYSGYIDQLYTRRALRDQNQQAIWQRQSNTRVGSWQDGLAATAGMPAAMLTLPLAGPQQSHGPIPQNSPPLPETPSELEFALPFLAAQACRSGLAVDPNAAAGYFFLHDAYRKPLMPFTEPPSELFAVTPFPPMGPSEDELQAITALRRAIARLPAADQTGDEYTLDAVRTRVVLTNFFLTVGPTQIQPVVMYRQVGPQEIQPILMPPIRVGYLDAARSVLKDLTLVVNTAPADKLFGVAHALTPLWRRVLQLCEADFWMEFPRYRDSGRVPKEWWPKFGRPSEFVSVLVDQDYLKKDDWDGWQDKFDPDAPPEKLDVAQIRLRLERLQDVVNNLVGRRLARLPRETGDRPAAAFLGRVVSGLPETAIKMVEGGNDGAKVDVGGSPADVLRLMLWVGRAEDVQDYFKRELQKLDDSKAPANELSLERTKFRVVEYELAKLNGDYTEAEAIYTELLTTPVGDMPPPQTMTAIVFPDLWRPVAFPELSPVELKLYANVEAVFRGSSGLTGGLGTATTERRLDALRTRLLYQAVTRYQRGVYALLAGDTVRAKEHFEKAANPQDIRRFLPPLPADATKEMQDALPIQRLGAPPQLGVPFNQFLPKYLELLRKYEAK